MSGKGLQAIVKNRGNASKIHFGNGWVLRFSEAKRTDADRLYRTIHRAIDGMTDEWFRGFLCRMYETESLALERFFEQSFRHSLFMLELSGDSVSSAIPVAIGGLQELTAKQVEEQGYQDAAGLIVAEVVAMYTDQACQGFGLAGWVIEEVLKCAERWGVNRLVLKSSHTAKGVYERYGFEKSGEPKVRFDDRGNRHLGGIPMSKDIWS